MRSSLLASLCLLAHAAAAVKVKVVMHSDQDDSEIEEQRERRRQRVDGTELPFLKRHDPEEAARPSLHPNDMLFPLIYRQSHINSMFKFGENWYTWSTEKRADGSRALSYYVCYDEPKRCDDVGWVSRHADWLEPSRTDPTPDDRIATNFDELYMGAHGLRAQVRLRDRLGAARRPRVPQRVRRGAPGRRRQRRRRLALRRRRPDEGERGGALVRAPHPLAVAVRARGPALALRLQAGRCQLARLRGRGGVLPHRGVQDPPRPHHLLAARADARPDLQERAEARAAGRRRRRGDDGGASEARRGRGPPREGRRSPERVPRATEERAGRGERRPQGTRRLRDRREARHQKQNQNSRRRLGRFLRRQLAPPTTSSAGRLIRDHFCHSYIPTLT